MRTKINSKLFLIFVTTLLFLIAIAFNISPLLRGPDDPLIESRWPYYFVNTFHKTWIPLIPLLAILLLFYLTDAKQKLRFILKTRYILFLLIIFMFVWQISLVHFSRFGIGILFRRVVDPGINGYFSSAIQIDNAQTFIQDFPKIMPSLDQHARGHPPGGVLLLHGVISVFEQFPVGTNAVLSFVPIPDSEALLIWNNLSPPQRAASIFLGFFLHGLATLGIIPLYFIAKYFTDKKTAIRALFLYAVFPSVSFFALLLDPFYAILSLASFLLLLIGLRKDNFFVILPGIIFGIGLFFSYSILPMGFLSILFVVFSKQSLQKSLRSCLFYILGISVALLIQMMIDFPVIESFLAVIAGQVPRSYLHWLVFNPYDFFVYLSIPISVLFFFASKHLLRRTNSALRPLCIAFWISFCFLVLFGISRGEVGRIWIPLMTMPIILVAWYSEQLHFSTKNFTILLFLIGLQTILMEEFWVPIW